jgi:hypothetical protein
MNEIDWSPRQRRQRERTSYGFLLDAWRASFDKSTEVFSASGEELVDPGCDRATVLAVNLNE